MLKAWAAVYFSQMWVFGPFEVLADAWCWFWNKLALTPQARHLNPKGEEKKRGEELTEKPQEGALSLTDSAGAPDSHQKHRQSYPGVAPTSTPWFSEWTSLGTLWECQWSRATGAHVSVNRRLPWLHDHKFRQIRISQTPTPSRVKSTKTKTTGLVP